MKYYEVIMKYLIGFSIWKYLISRGMVNRRSITLTDLTLHKSFFLAYKNKKVKLSAFTFEMQKVQSTENIDG
jgi:hypothetical protein